MGGAQVMERLLNESSRKVSDIRETRRPGIQRRRLPVHGIRFEDRCWKGIIVRTNMLCPCATPVQRANFQADRFQATRKRERDAELATIRAMNKVRGQQRRRLPAHDDIPEVLTNHVQNMETHNEWAKQIRGTRKRERDEELAKIRAMNKVRGQQRRRLPAHDDIPEVLTNHVQNMGTLKSRRKELV